MYEEQRQWMKVHREEERAEEQEKMRGKLGFVWGGGPVSDADGNLQGTRLVPKEAGQVPVQSIARIEVRDVITPAVAQVIVRVLRHIQIYGCMRRNNAHLPHPSRLSWCALQGVSRYALVH